MKTKIFILAALIFSLILFTVSCIADDPADESNNVSRSESTPQEESVNESTPPEESKPAEESKLEESIPPEESKPEESEPPEESKPAEESEPAETSNTEDKTYAQPMISENFPKTPDVITVPEGYQEIHSLIDSGEYTKAYKLLIEKENDIYATQLLRNFGSYYETQKYQFHDTVRGIDGTYNVFNYFYENGSPKSVYHTMYEYLHGSGCLSDGVTGFYFDNNGLLQTVSNSSHKYYYDSEGRLIKSTDIRDGYSDTKLFFWNDHGLLERIETTTHSSDDVLEIRRFAYDGNGRIIHYETYKSDMGVYRIQTWKHDEQGRITEESLNGKTTKYTYGENGKLVRTEETAYDGAVIVETRTYDESGNLLITERMNGEELIYRCVYEYDENGFIKSKEWEGEPSYTVYNGDYGRIEYTTDEYGRITEAVLKSVDEVGGYRDEVTKYAYNEDGDLIMETNHSYKTGSYSIREYEGFGAWYHKYYSFYDIFFPTV